MYFFEHYGMEEDNYFRLSRLDDLSFPLHFHRAYELIVLEKGEMMVSVEENDYLLTAGESVLVFPNQLHKLMTHDSSSCQVIIFSPELIGQFFSDYKGSVPLVNKLTDLHLPDAARAESLYAQKSYLYYICDQLIQMTDFIPAKVTGKRKTIQKMLLYIDENYQNECTLKKVSKAIQYDYAYLSKLFYQFTKQSFTNYVNRYRITQASYLLEASEDPISEIAQKCGYKTLRTFNRNFKEYKSVSPSLYREKVKLV